MKQCVGASSSVQSLSKKELNTCVEAQAILAMSESESFADDSSSVASYSETSSSKSISFNISRGLVRVFFLLEMDFEEELSFFLKCSSSSCHC